MPFRVLGLALLVGSLCFAAKKSPVTKHGENDLFAIEATLYKDYDDVKNLLGFEIEKGVVVIAVKVTPKGEDPYPVWRDDFLIRSDKDGQRSEPYDPGQIASDTVITLVYTEDGGGDIAQQQQGPTWGGIPGQEPGRTPTQMPGSGPSSIGNTGSVERVSGSKVETDSTKANNPELQILRDHVLKEDKIVEPSSGWLYYPLDGKHKPKHIWLHYVGDGGKIDLQFKPEN
jgi:hypothetical protein